MELRLLIALAVQKADEISQPAEATPVALRAATSFVLALSTTDSSSDTVLGHGWASQNYSAATIDPLARGVSWLLSETGIPRRVKAAYLSDADIKHLAAYAAQLHRKDHAHAA